MTFDFAGKLDHVAGHTGMVGGALVRRVALNGYEVLIFGSSVDLRDQALVCEWFAADKTDFVVLAAAEVGGIAANDTFPLQFFVYKAHGRGDHD